MEGRGMTVWDKCLQAGWLKPLLVGWLQPWFVGWLKPFLVACLLAVACWLVGCSRRHLTGLLVGGLAESRRFAC